jgi:hypothetical protein
MLLLVCFKDQLQLRKLCIPCGALVEVSDLVCWVDIHNIISNAVVIFVEEFYKLLLDLLGRMAFEIKVGAHYAKVRRSERILVKLIDFIPELRLHESDEDY